MGHCPKCESKDIRRSPTRSRWERWRKEITGKRPYRCRRCQWRGWLPITPGETDAGRRTRAAADPPNLRGTLLARADPRLKMDLKDLDRFHTITDKDDQ